MPPRPAPWAKHGTSHIIPGMHVHNINVLSCHGTASLNSLALPVSGTDSETEARVCSTFRAAALLTGGTTEA